MRGYVQDVTHQKYHEARTQGLELAIRGFQHMIPGKADEAIGCLELNDHNENTQSEIQKALAFMFMVRHKSDEVKSLFFEKSYFQSYSLGDILDKAWPIALDLAKVDRDDLMVIYGANTSEDTQVNGAFYTAALNVFSNARLHGSTPFMIWTIRNENQFIAVIADGGPNSRANDKLDRGIGLALTKKVLQIVGGDVEQ